MKTIHYVYHNDGRLANQMWSILSLKEYCVKHKCNLRVWCFWEYDHLFEKPITWWPFRGFNYLFRFLTKFIPSRYARWILIYLFKALIFGIRTSNLSENDWKKSSRKIIFVNGFYSQKITTGTANLVFSIKKNLVKNAEYQLKKLRKKYADVIGVHLRLTDFRNWSGGAYLITEKMAEDYLKSLKFKKSCFLVMSDEKVRLNVNHCYYPSSNSPISDLYSLSKCDAIIGTDSSTFGLIGSVLGGTTHNKFSDNFKIKKQLTHVDRNN